MTVSGRSIKSKLSSLFYFTLLYFTLVRSFILSIQSVAAFRVALVVSGVEDDFEDDAQYVGHVREIKYRKRERGRESKKREREKLREHNGLRLSTAAEHKHTASCWLVVHCRSRL